MRALDPSLEAHARERKRDALHRRQPSAPFQKHRQQHPPRFPSLWYDRFARFEHEYMKHAKPPNNGKKRLITSTRGRRACILRCHTRLTCRTDTALLKQSPKLCKAAAKAPYSTLPSKKWLIFTMSSSTTSLHFPATQLAIRSLMAEAGNWQARRGSCTMKGRKNRRQKKAGLYEAAAGQ